jgi:putative transposase
MSAESNIVTRLQAYRFQLLPTEVQTNVELCAEMVRWKEKPEMAWLNEEPSQALQQALKNLESGWARHFDSLKKLKQGRIQRSQMAGEPVFKRKGQHDSFRYPQGFELQQGDSRLFLPKMGWVRYRNSREVLGTVKNVTVSLSAGKWYISVQTERVIEPPIHSSNLAVGIDAGETRFDASSMDESLVALDSFRKYQKARERAQRVLNHKLKFSKN